MTTIVMKFLENTLFTHSRPWDVLLMSRENPNVFGDVRGPVWCHAKVHEPVFGAARQNKTSVLIHNQNNKSYSQDAVNSWTNDALSNKVWFRMASTVAPLAKGLEKRSILGYMYFMLHAKWTSFVDICSCIKHVFTACI